MNGDRDWQATFEQTYAAPPSAVGERVWRQVFGDEYPEGVDPYSFITVSELERFAREIDVDSDGTIADLGCGRGGPGLWLAMATGAKLVGVDIAENALEAARQRAAALGLAERATYHRATFDATTLEAASIDAVISVDALLFAPDKAAAFAEIRRILRDGARLVFTSWDYHRQPVNRPPQVDDHRPLLTGAGFEVLAYDETEEWDRRAERTVAGLRDNVEELAAESGEDVATIAMQLDEMQDSIDAMSRRVLAVARAAHRRD